MDPDIDSRRVTIALNYRNLHLTHQRDGGLFERGREIEATEKESPRWVNEFTSSLSFRDRGREEGERGRERVPFVRSNRVSAALSTRKILAYVKIQQKSRRARSIGRSIRSAF